MLAYVVLILAVLSRLLPHALHGVGLNVTAVGGGLLFFGARRSAWQAAIAAGVMACTDVYLTKFVYGYPFHVRGYLLTWAWYAVTCLIGAGLLRHPSMLRGFAAVFFSATGFFLRSNLEVWAGGGLYPRTLAGLSSCFVAAIPFYANDLVSTGLTALVLFGLPAAATRLVTAWHEAQDRSEPLA